MDERGEVNELDDDRQVHVPGRDSASRSAAKQGEKRPETFPAAAYGISDITLNRGIKRSRLLRDSRFHFVEVALNESRDASNRSLGNDGSSSCGGRENFHKFRIEGPFSNVKAWRCFLLQVGGARAPLCPQNVSAFIPSHFLDWGAHRDSRPGGALASPNG